MSTELHGLCESNPEPRTANGAEAASGFNLIETIECMLQDGEKDVLGRVRARVDKELIVRALRQTRGHQGLASELLGIDRKTLRTRLRTLGLRTEGLPESAPE